MANFTYFYFIDEVNCIEPTPGYTVCIQDFLRNNYLKKILNVTFSENWYSLKIIKMNYLEYFLRKHLKKFSQISYLFVFKNIFKNIFIYLRNVCENAPRLV
jgi:hypothetical protein